MLARIAADLVVLLHLAFVVFVVLGGLLVLRWTRIAWVHLPCAIWGALVELADWACPLTDVENRLRIAAGGQGHSRSFIEHHVVPVIYPEGLSATTRVALGVLVIATNAVVYGWWLRRRLRRRPTSA